MPYLKDRVKFIKILDELRNCKLESSGEINYLITCIMKHYIDCNGKGYQRLNDCLGACEGAKIEFYRRIVSKVEDLKIHDNGDVY